MIHVPIRSEISKILHFYSRKCFFFFSFDLNICNMGADCIMSGKSFQTLVPGYLKLYWNERVLCRDIINCREREERVQKL